MSCHESGSSYWTIYSKALPFWYLRVTWLVTTATLSHVHLTFMDFAILSTQEYAAGIYLVQNICQFCNNQDPRSTSAVSDHTTHEAIVRIAPLSALRYSIKCLQSMYPRFQLKCYTDSQVALYWIKGVEKEWKPFVQNRVTEVWQLHVTSQNCWAHCPGTLNPADLPSRGISQLELSVSRLWPDGPERLPVEVFQERECDIEEEPCNLPCQVSVSMTWRI